MYKTPKNCLLVLILDSSPAYESESKVGLASPSLESGRTNHNDMWTLCLWSHCPFNDQFQAKFLGISIFFAFQERICKMCHWKVCWIHGFRWLLQPFLCATKSGIWYTLWGNFIKIMGYNGQYQIKISQFTVLFPFSFSWTTSTIYSMMCLQTYRNIKKNKY